MSADNRKNISNYQSNLTSEKLSNQRRKKNDFRYIYKEKHTLWGLYTKVSVVLKACQSWVHTYDAKQGTYLPKEEVYLTLTTFLS